MLNTFDRLMVPLYTESTCTVNIGERQGLFIKDSVPTKNNKPVIESCPLPNSKLDLTKLEILHQNNTGYNMYLINLTMSRIYYRVKQNTKSNYKIIMRCQHLQK